MYDHIFIAPSNIINMPGEKVMKIKQTGLLLFIILMFTSCKPSQDTFESLPGINIPADKLNTSIKLIDPPEFLNSHKNGETLSFQIINLSNATIVFPENYGIKLFTNRNGEWTEVSNNSYNGGSTFYLPTKDSYPLGLVVGTLPYILDLTTPTSVRVIIIGHKENDNEQVGAYIDVTISP